MAIFTVINTNDAGAGSLRQAVVDANITPGSTIDIQVSGTISLTTGQLSITQSTTIIKTAVGTIVVSGSNLSRVFNIAAAGITVSISDITISNGSDNSAGGINMIVASSLTINNCIFTNNDGSIGSGSGGAILVSGATLAINNCTFQSNKGTNGGNLFINESTVTIIDSVLQTGNATNLGGGLRITGITSDVSLFGCLIQNNISTTGGGILHTSGNLTINNSSINNNISTTSGGISHTTGNLTINNSTINGNSATNSGGGITSSTTGILQIFNSTISNNTANTLVGGIGLASTGNKTLINCTFNGNTSPDGGGVRQSSGTSTIIGCTISNNISTGGAGGGVTLAGGTITIGNTVVAINPLNVTPDFSIIAGTLVSLGNNFIGNATGTAAVFTQPGDQAGTTLAPINPLLLSLGNYGGPTQTMLPQSTPASPLINAGSNTIVTTYYIYPQVLSLGVPIDQRGYSRIVGGVVDIGSVESGQFICFSGESLVLTRNCQTDRIEMIRAKNVVASIHEVYDVVSSSFIPVKRNVVNGPVVRFFKIAKNILGNNQPNEDFYVTGGHKILIDGKHIKARDIPQAKRVKVKPQKVYSICTENQSAIMINGLAVMTWSEENFLRHSQKQNLIWIDNLSESLFDDYEDNL